MGMLVQGATVAANGTATVTFAQYSPSLVWKVYQVSVGLNPITQGAQAFLTHDGQPVTSSAFGYSDAAAGDPPIYLRASETLTVQWTNAGVGGQATATIYYEEIPTAELSRYLGGLA